MRDLITLDISDKGIDRITLFCDTEGQQCAAHILLGAVSHELRALDAALRSCRQGQGEPNGVTDILSAQQDQSQ